MAKLLSYLANLATKTCWTTWKYENGNTSQWNFFRDSVVQITERNSNKDNGHLQSEKPVSFRNNYNKRRCMLLKITTFLEFPLTSSFRQVLFKFFKGYFYQFCGYRCFHPCQWPRVEDWRFLSRNLFKWSLLSIHEND